MLRRKRKGSKPDTEGEPPATEPPSPRPRSVTTDSGMLARAKFMESAKREQRSGGGTDDEREDRDGSKKKGGRIMDLVSQTKKNFKGGSGTLSLRWTATKKKSTIASSLSSSDLRAHSSSAGDELSSDSDSSPESPANGLNARPRTERKRSKLTTDEGEDLFDEFRERPMSSRGSRSSSSSHEHASVEVGSNDGKGSLKAKKAKPRKLLTDRPGKRSELGDDVDHELCGNDRAIGNLQLLPVEALESKRARGSSIPGVQCDLPLAPIPPPLNLPEPTATALPLGQFGLLAAPIPPPLDLPIGPPATSAVDIVVVANSKPKNNSTKSASPPMKVLLSAPLPPPLNLPAPTTTTTTSSSVIYPAVRPSAAAAPGISRRATSPRLSSHSAPLPTTPLSSTPSPASPLATSGSRPTSAAAAKASPSAAANKPSPLSTKPRPVLPALRLPMGGSGGLSPLSSLTSRAVYTPTPQSPSLSLVSPRYARSPLHNSEGRRLLTPKPLGTVRSYEGRTESGGDLDKALEEMIHSRWEEYDNIRRIRSGNRRYRQSTRMSVLCEPEAIGKLETDANVFLGAIKEMVKRRSLSRQCEETQPAPTRATNKTRRRKEREMRMSRERNSAARASVGPGRVRYSMCLSSSDGLESSVDDSFPDLVTPPSSSPLSSSLEVPPPPPPPPPPSGLITVSPIIAEEDGKWGVNMLSSEQPQAYEDLFTLTPAEIENVPGIYRWRIEHLVPVFIPQDDEDHPLNHFYESDCYLVLYVGRTDEDDELDDGSPLKKDAPAGGDKEGTMTYNLHYWIGRTSSVDKKASVCFRAVQLNSYIGGKAKHYPEQHGEESATFLSYFRRTSRRPSLSGSGNVRTRSNSASASTIASASMAPTTTTTTTSLSATSAPISETRDIVYLEGGTDCGLRRVKGVEEYETARLYRFFTLEDDDTDEEDEQASSLDADPWVLYAYDEYEAAARKRKRNGRHYYIQLVELATASLNERDVFLLDTGGYRLYQWNGKQSRQWLNLVCNEILLMINVIERKSLAQIEVLSGGEGEGPAVRRRKRSLFWRYLDGSHKQAAAASQQSTTNGNGNGGEQENNAGGAKGQEEEEEEEELSAKTEQKEEKEEEEEKKQVRHRADGDDDLADEALGGIVEILEVRGEYGSMDLHTMWVQKKPSVLRAAAASTTTLGHEEGIKPSRRILSSQGVFIIDCTSEIYVYSGRKSTPYSRQIALFIANQMKDDDNKDDSRRPVWTITMEVKERQEPILFKARFSDWLDTDDSGKWGAKQKVAPKDYRPFHERLLDEIKKGKLKPPEQPDIDVASLFPPEAQGAQHAMASELSAEAGPAPAAGEVDEILELLNRVRSNSQSSADDNALTDSSSVEVGILAGRTFSKLPEAEVGHFYSGESYVVLHSFHDRAKDARQWVVYFWEGKGASKLTWPTFQLGIFPALEEKIVSSGGGAPAKRRIYQGEETPVFMSLFKNNLVVIRRGQRPRTATAAATTEMFEAKCLPGDATKRLVSVECNPHSLHSSGAYGLFLPSGKVFIWRGKQSLPQSTDALTWLIDAATAALQKDSPAAHTGPPSQERASDDSANNGSSASERHEWRNGVDIHFIAEDEEPSEFWAALGCTTSARARRRSEAPDVARVACEPGTGTSARLVKFCYDGGRFTAGEVVGFKQRDLLQNCVYLLRPHTAPAPEAPLYLWLGRQATDRLRAAARRTAERYVAHLLQTTTTTPTTATTTTPTTKVEKNESDTVDTNKSEAAGQAPTRPEASEVDTRDSNGDDGASASATRPAMVVRVEEVEEGSEPGEFTRYFAEWAATGFVDPYELRLIELRKLGALAFDYVAAEEQLREPLVRLVDGEDDGGDAAALEAEAQPTPEELERKNREREEFMRKLREDRLRKEERRRMREKKEEEERLRRREKQDRLRAKLKLLELQVVHYKVDPDDEEYEEYPDGSQTAHATSEAWGMASSGGADDEQRRCDSARAAGSVPAVGRQRSQSTDVAVVRLKERQDQFINRLKSRSRSRISYAGKDRSSASSSVNLLLQHYAGRKGSDPTATIEAAAIAAAMAADGLSE